MRKLIIGLCVNFVFSVNLLAVESVSILKKKVELRSESEIMASLLQNAPESKVLRDVIFKKLSSYGNQKMSVSQLIQLVEETFNPYRQKGKLDEE